MDYNSTRSFTMTLAHRAVGDIRRGGFRQLRNYVDMCATLAKKPQQKDFFAYAQKALQRTDSCYYSMIHRLLDSVEEDRICTVGVNMGFGGLIYGASEMKKQADVDGKPFSWITAAHCGDPALPALVAAAEKKGSFVWVLDATEGDPSEAASLAKAFYERAGSIVIRQAACAYFVIDRLGHAVAADDDLVPIGHAGHIGAGQGAFGLQILHHLGVVDQRTEGGHFVAVGQQVIGQLDCAVHAKAEARGLGTDNIHRYTSFFRLCALGLSLCCFGQCGLFGGLCCLGGLCGGLWLPGRLRLFGSLGGGVVGLNSLGCLHVKSVGFQQGFQLVLQAVLHAAQFGDLVALVLDLQDSGGIASPKTMRTLQKRCSRPSLVP